MSLVFLVESTKEIKAINYYLNANQPAFDRIDILPYQLAANGKI